MPLKNYTLSSSEIYFARLDEDQKPGDFRYVGNSPEFSLTVSTDVLEYLNPDEGLNEVQLSVQRGVTRSGTLVLDDIQDENVAAFFFGSVSSYTQAADAADQTQEFTGDALSNMVSRADNFEWHPLGVTAANPVGHRGFSALALDNALAEDTDYNVDLGRGRFRLRPTDKVKALTGSDTLTATYRRRAITAAEALTQIESGTQPITVMIKAYEDNIEGVNKDWTLPVAEISPSGEMALKGEEVRTIPFSVSVQSPSLDGVEAFYINGVPQDVPS